MEDISNNMKTTVTKVSVTFSDLTLRRLRVPEFQTNLIRSEPCSFVSRKLPRCSIICPTETQRIAMNVVNFQTAMGLFIGLSPAFFASARAGSYAIWRASFCPLNAESHLLSEQSDGQLK
jgi:hypothetical protein